VKDLENSGVVTKKWYIPRNGAEKKKREDVGGSNFQQRATKNRGLGKTKATCRMDLLAGKIKQGKRKRKESRSRKKRREAWQILLERGTEL